MKKTFRLVGYLEAVSFLFLLCVAMPMKYAYHIPTATKMPGSIHGFLFVAYCVLAYNLAQLERWDSKKKWTAFIASVVPFGTFIFNHNYLQD